MGYVLQREDGKFVARPGSSGSYVRDLPFAWVFATPEEAEYHKCENERVVSIDSLVRSR